MISNAKSKNETKKQEKFIKKILKVLKQKSKKSLEIARETILKENIKSEEVRKALNYYAKNFLEPTPSAFLALVCEAVSHDAKDTSLIGASLTLLVGAVDIHDDIIDQSTVKNGRQTVFGKFGKEIALLVGDAFLFGGFILLHKAVLNFKVKKAERILESLKAAFFEMGDAHALEATLRGNIEVRLEEYLQIVKMKAACWEAITKIGAIIGNGTEKEVKILSKYGRVWGILSTIRNDFIDLFEISELQNRMINEILPLPILCAFEDLLMKEKIVRILSKKKITRNDLEMIQSMVFGAKKTREIIKMLRGLIFESQTSLTMLKKSKAKDILGEFISVMLEDLN